MPNFFDKKEEVINLELTQYGKHLLSIGKLEPVYYAFYDEDVLYDTKYAGYEELQNKAQNRILEETPVMKVQYVLSGIESTVAEATKTIRDDYTKKFFDPQYSYSEFIQQTAEKVYSNSLPLGTSDYASSYSPSWNIKMLDGEIKDATRYFTGSHANIRVPQINIKGPTYLSKVASGTPPELEQCKVLAPGDTPGKIEPDFNIINDVNITSRQYQDGTYMKIEQNNIVLQIDEMNSLFTNDNFDIEVFLVEEDNDVVGGNTSNKEKLIPLYFVKKPDNIINDILVDLPVQEEPEVTKENIEYYLDILTDNELPDEYWASLGAYPRSGEVFYNEATFEEGKKGLDSDIAIQGLYTSDNSKPFGEEC